MHDRVSRTVDKHFKPTRSEDDSTFRRVEVRTEIKEPEL